uniref:N-acetyltransferase family protein n=1 Tax=Acetatifactor sp. TaxID=1872090 RepID=UPI0040571B88
MKVIVRLASSADIDGIEELYNDLNDYLEKHVNYPRWKKGVYPVREHAEEALRKGNLYVAIINKKIVGTVIYSSEQEDAYQTAEWQIDYDVPVIIINKLAVHPEYLGFGVGKALLEYATIIGTKQGIKTIRLDTYEENLPAIRLYEKCGFSYRGMIDLGLEQVYGLKWYKVFEKLL